MESSCVLVGNSTWKFRNVLIIRYNLYRQTGQMTNLLINLWKWLYKNILGSIKMSLRKMKQNDLKNLLSNERKIESIRTFRIIESFCKHWFFYIIILKWSSIPMFSNMILPYIEPNCWVPNVFSLHANLKKSMMIMKKEFGPQWKEWKWSVPFCLLELSISRTSTFTREHPLFTWPSKVTVPVSLVLETACFLPLTYLKRTYQKLQKDLLHDFAQSNK